MTAAILFIYGVIVIASCIMIVAWGKAARSLWRKQELTLSTARWCKAWVIAVSLTGTAASMVYACGYRAYDIMVNAASVGGSDSLLLLIGIGLVAASKVGFIWAGSIEEVHRRVRWPWWLFIYCVILWGVLAMAWEGSILA